jgi:hypothetical protein
MGCSRVRPLIDRRVKEEALSSPLKLSSMIAVLNMHRRAVNGTKVRMRAVFYDLSVAIAISIMDSKQRQTETQRLEGKTL